MALTVSCTPPPIQATLVSGSATLRPTFVLTAVSYTPTLSPTPIADTPALTLTPVLKIEVCSPLAALSLDKFPTYTTQPFIAPGASHDSEHPARVQKDDGHHGLDIGYYKVDDKLFTGTPALAALSGKIAAIVHDRPPYGNMVMVETPFERIPPALIAREKMTTGASLYTLYAHLQNLQTLTIGQPVTCGQPLAETGLTGFTGGPHLHFETRWGPPGETFASMAYYRADATPEEMENYETWRMSAVFHLFDPMQLLQTSDVRP